MSSHMLHKDIFGVLSTIEAIVWNITIGETWTLACHIA